MSNTAFSVFFKNYSGSWLRVSKSRGFQTKHFGRSGYSGYIGYSGYTGLPKVPEVTYSEENPDTKTNVQLKFYFLFKIPNRLPSFGVARVAEI